ncbi:unnamed protein product [Caenorhabditis brenneri]
MTNTGRQKSWEQRKALKAQFAINNYISEQDCNRLGEETGLSIESIKHWFCNQRYTNKLRSAEVNRTSNSRGRHKSEEQVKALEAQYAKNSFLSKQDRVQLQKETGLSQLSITRWFDTRRRRERLCSTQRERSLNSSPEGWMGSLEVDSLPGNTAAQQKSEEQVKALKARFAKSCYISEQDCIQLGEETGLSQLSIRNWSSAQRYAERTRVAREEKYNEFHRSSYSPEDTSSSAGNILTASVDSYRYGILTPEHTPINDENFPIIKEEAGTVRKSPKKKRTSVLFRPYEIEDSSASKEKPLSEFLADQMENLKRAVAEKMMIWNSQIHGNPLVIMARTNTDNNF